MDLVVAVKALTSGKLCFLAKQLVLRVPSLQFAVVLPTADFVAFTIILNLQYHSQIQQT